jgi:hypothetical protein
MHKNQNKTWLSLVLCLSALIFSFNLFAQAEEIKVSNFEVVDVEGDGGNGLLLKWTPLPNDLRILEYRVYRGTTPDTLYYLGNVTLNPEVGFSGDELTFADQGYKPYVDKTSPSFLRREKRVKGKEVYYGTDQKGVPRDMSILEQDNGKYTFIAQIERSMFYSRTKEIKDGDETYVGYPIGNVSILASVKTGQEYFYSVVPINENRKFYSPSEIKSGTPKQDPATRPAKKFYAALLTEDSQPKFLNFEWEDYADSYASETFIYLFEEDFETAKASFTDETVAVNPNIININAEFNRFTVDVINDGGVYYLNGKDGRFEFDALNPEKYTVAIVSNAGNVFFLNENQGQAYQQIQTAIS